MSEIWLDSETWFYKPSVGDVWQERFRGRLFDSYLGRSSHPTQNHILKLFMRVYLHPVNKRHFALDADRRSFPTKPWTPRAWEKFQDEFAKQSRLWNNRFWLIPPQHFSIADAGNNGNWIRPNVICMLFVELVDNPANAHHNIKVMNVDVAEVKRRDSIDNDDPLLGQFRSNNRTLDSTDVRTGPRTITDIEGDEYTVEHHYTIAHEIGHDLGLSHIGVLKHTKRCELALKFKKDKVDPKSIRSQYRGGSNASVCYGLHDDEHNLGENIMGIGYKFAEINATPWTERIAMHTNTMSNDWRVSLAPISPRAVTEKDRHASDRKKWIAT